MTETKKDVGNIYQRLLCVQEKLEVPKSQVNRQFGGYKYRNLEDIMEAVKPLLKDVQALIILSDEIDMIGDRYYVKAKATFQCCVNPETSISVTASAREVGEKKGMDGSQITGASSSYARKYALNGLLAIDDTKDADANGSEKTSTTKKTTSSKPVVNVDIKKMQEEAKVLIRKLGLAHDGGAIKALLGDTSGLNAIEWRKKIELLKDEIKKKEN